MYYSKFAALFLLFVCPVLALNGQKVDPDHYDLGRVDFSNNGYGRIGAVRESGAVGVIDKRGKLVLPARDVSIYFLERKSGTQFMSWDSVRNLKIVDAEMRIIEDLGKVDNVREGWEKGQLVALKRPTQYPHPNWRTRCKCISTLDDGRGVYPCEVPGGNWFERSSGDSLFLKSSTGKMIAGYLADDGFWGGNGGVVTTVGLVPETNRHQLIDASGQKIGQLISGRIVEGLGYRSQLSWGHWWETWDSDHNHTAFHFEVLGGLLVQNGQAVAFYDLNGEKQFEISIPSRHKSSIRIEVVDLHDGTYGLFVGSYNGGGDCFNFEGEKLFSFKEGEIEVLNSGIVMIDQGETLQFCSFEGKVLKEYPTWLHSFHKVEPGFGALIWIKEDKETKPMLVNTEGEKISIPEMNTSQRSSLPPVRKDPFNNLWSVKDGEHWALYDEKRHEIIASGFSEELRRSHPGPYLTQNKGQGVIFVDTTGKNLPHEKLSWATEFNSNGYAIAKSQNTSLYGVIGQDGKWVLPPQFDEIFQPASWYTEPIEFNFPLSVRKGEAWQLRNDKNRCVIGCD